MTEDTMEHRRDRVREFVRLADQILRNPAVVEGLSTTLRFEATQPDGSGSMWLEGPHEYLLRALLLDIRNVIQARSDLRLPKVLQALRDSIDDEHVVAVIDQIGQQFEAIGEKGLTVNEGGDPIRPATVVDLWMYAIYHHRDLAKLRQIRALDPMTRLVHQQEFHEYLRGLCDQVENTRRLIDEAKRAGLITDEEIAPYEPPGPPPAGGLPPQTIAIRVLMAQVASAGGRLSYTPAEIDQVLADYGESRRLRVNVTVNRKAGQIERMELHLLRGDGSDPRPRGLDRAP